MDQLPEFDDAAVWVIYPAHLTDDEIMRANRALEEALPKSAPVMPTVTRDNETSSRNPALIGLGVYVAKQAVKGAITVIRDQYRAEQAAQKSYNDRAERYNRERDQYFGHR